MKKHPFQEKDIVKHSTHKQKKRGVIQRYDQHDDTVKVEWGKGETQWEYAKDMILLERLPITITTSYV